jgi:phosphoribosylformylglycinamidine (FGAM) synthase-like enzyme
VQSEDENENEDTRILADKSEDEQNADKSEDTTLRTKSKGGGISSIAQAAFMRGCSLHATQNEVINEKSKNEVMNEKSQKYINDLRSTRTKDSQTKSKHNKRNESSTVLPEILEHLKVLGDDIKRRQQKKDIKHEIKHIHLKDKVQNTVIQPVQIDIQPRYVRPKLDLVTLCSRY